VLGGGLQEGGLPLLGQLAAVFGGDLPAVVHVGFVADQHRGEVVLAGDVDQFVVERRHHFERLHVFDAVNEDVTVHVQAVLRGEHRELVLAGGVHQDQLVVGRVDPQGLLEGVLDRGVVRLEELAFDELHAQRGFTYRTVAHQGDFSLLRGRHLRLFHYWTDSIAPGTFFAIFDAHEHTNWTSFFISSFRNSLVGDYAIIKQGIIIVFISSHNMVQHFDSH
jgi:hypothetical protein